MEDEQVIRYEFRTTPSGAKAYQREADDENRVKDYCIWHRTLPKSFKFSDIDGIEWRERDNGIEYPAAVIELTRADMGIVVTQGYRDKIVNRFNHGGNQGYYARYVAAKLEVKAWIVLFRQDLSTFWMYNLTEDIGFKQAFSQEQYIRFLSNL